MSTTPNQLPFSPLTSKGLLDLMGSAAQAAAVSLSFRIRYSSGSLSEDVERALPHAIRYSDLLAASMQRLDASEATR